MDFYSTENLSIKDIVSKMKELKYQKVILVNTDNDFSSAIINLDKENNSYTKRDLTFHLPKSKKCKTEKECAICLDKINVGQFERNLQGCDHTFHKKCVDEWFYQSTSYSCPLCRNNIYKLKL